jgi:uncharacterized protein (TIGR03435 family)
MQGFGHTFGLCRKLLLSATGLVAVAVLVVFGLANAKQVWARLQTQNGTAATPEFKFDVVSIKPTRLGPQDAWGFQHPNGGILANNISLLMLIQDAFEIYEHDRILGIPNWLSSERFNVEAKLDSNTADEFQKLTKEQRKLVRQQMLQALLADRIKLVVHQETRELPVFLLVLAKSGLKLQESKPNPTDPDATNNPIFGGTVRSEGIIRTGKWIASSDLAGWLSGEIGRTVVDKTGLMGRYDFSVQYTREQDQLQSPPTETGEGQPAQIRSDLTFAPLLTAIQQQLGLKLESGKGPVGIIVIDHVERPSEN